MASSGEPTRAAGSDKPIKTDLVVGGLLILFAVLVFGWTFTFDKAPAALAQNVQPASFPRLVAVIIIILTSVMMILSHGSSPAKPRKSLKFTMWTTAAAMLMFVLAFSYLGIVVAMVLFCLFFPMSWGERRLHWLIPFALIFPAIIYFLFAKMLGVFFEPGIMGF